MKLGKSQIMLNQRSLVLLILTESKLDNTVRNAEININGYGVIRNDRNRHGGGVACYIRNDLVFNTKNLFFKFYRTCVF